MVLPSLPVSPPPCIQYHPVPFSLSNRRRRRRPPPFGPFSFQPSSPYPDCVVFVSLGVTGRHGFRRRRSLLSIR